jgi:hypothetical protein
VTLGPAAPDVLGRESRPAHRNLSLEDFGLSRDRVHRDLQFVFEKYGFDFDGPAAETAPGREA